MTQRFLISSLELRSDAILICFTPSGDAAAEPELTSLALCTGNDTDLIVGKGVAKVNQAAQNSEHAS